MINYSREEIEIWLDENESQIDNNSSPENKVIQAYHLFISQETVEEDNLSESTELEFIEDVNHEDFRTWFISIALKKYVLESKFSYRFLNAIEWIYMCHQDNSLICLRDIFVLYRKPRNLSPRQVLSHKKCKVILEEESIKHNYRIEEVVKYFEKRIQANKTIALHYLERLDNENYELVRQYLKHYNGEIDVLDFLFHSVYNHDRTISE